MTRISQLSASRMRGVTLVELLVALTLSMFLLGGIATMFVSSRATYESSQRIARIEENGRFALDSIARDVRAAGYVGCNQSAQRLTTLTGGEVVSGLWNFAEGIQGFDAQGTGWSPALDTAKVPEPLEGSDVLILHVPQPANPTLRLRAGMVMPTDEIPVKQYATGKGAFREKDQILMISSCDHSTVFENTKYDPQAGTIAHAKSSASATTPGNSGDSLLWTYDNTATVVAVQTVIYYVRAFDHDGDTTTPGIPTLYRRVDNAPPEQLVDNVESMQLRFGYDSDSDRIANDNVKPSALTTPDRIVSASIALLVRSPETYGEKIKKTYKVLDQDVATDDRYMRKIFTTTASVRNTAR